MDIYQTLTIITSVTSTLTLILVAVAVLPHIKQGMLVIRDAILWVAFVLMVAIGGWAGWQGMAARLFSPTSRHADHVPSRQTHATVVTNAADRSDLDPYYRGPTSN